ncbi:putative methionyl-tRNA synthetase [Hordeum vulgare]|nr:putative methionyl-tRNA synthetase [Hordeum vulgare]
MERVSSRSRRVQGGVYNLDMLATAAAEGRPDGTKRVMMARDTIPSAEWLQLSIEQCIADAKSKAAKREEKSEARWSVMMMKQDAKLDLLRTSIAAKKRNTDLEFLMGADMSMMDEQVKAWYLAEHGLILKKMPGPATTTATTSSTKVVPTTPTTTSTSTIIRAKELVISVLCIWFLPF